MKLLLLLLPITALAQSPRPITAQQAQTIIRQQQLLLNAQQAQIRREERHLQAYSQEDLDRILAANRRVKALSHPRK